MTFSPWQWTVPGLLDRYRGYLMLSFVCGLVSLSSPAQSQEDLSIEAAESRDDPTETPLQRQQKKWEDILAPAHARSVTIVVGTYEQRPFVFWDGDQTYGYGVEVWDTIATALDVRTELVRYKSVSALLEAVKQGEVDVGVSGISITAAREGGGFDFSYPIYHGGLQLVVKQQKVSPLVVLVQELGGQQTLIAVVRLIVLSFIAGTLIWLTERKHNPEFPSNMISGIGQGIWFAVVTLGTFGYGDVTPRSFTGRFLAAIWMAFSFFVLGDFISSLTAARQARVEGTTLSTLTGKTLGATANTSAYYFLLHKPIRLESFTTFAEAVHALRDDRVVGVIGDYPTARYLVSQQPDFVLGGSLLDHESYGLVTADGNELLLEAIDRELLKLERSGQLQSVKDNWFGVDPNPNP
ncbi:MAG: transporter substrate-binding domain-containing protein [Prochlorotrichaceae cyanobacterium]